MDRCHGDTRGSLERERDCGDDCSIDICIKRRYIKKKIAKKYLCSIRTEDYSKVEKSRLSNALSWLISVFHSFFAAGDRYSCVLLGRPSDKCLSLSKMYKV